jgi:hypothetical protein
MGRARIAARALGWACGGALIAAPAAPAAPTLVKVGDFTSPTYVTGAPGDASRLFVTEQPGRIRVIRDGTTLAAPFLDVPGVLADAEERGLLSMAFAPDYATSGRFYVYLTAAGGEIQVREYHGAGDVADPASGRILLRIPHSEAANHNGGQLQFGPDGKLYLGTGDGGGGNNQFGHAQDPGSLLGKLIRLDVAAPTPEIVSVGLRNPWRFSFDRATGQIVIADVGQGAYEEVDVGLAPNYGWSCREGLHDGPGPACSGPVTDPVLERPHENGVCSITGGYVVRDPGLPTLLGRYVYGDNCSPDVRSVDLANPQGDASTGLSVQRLSSFGEDACGRVLAVSLSGPVYRLVDGATSPCGTPVAGGAGPVPDTRACSLAARVTGLRSVRRRHRISLALRADEACRATVSARIAGVASFRTASGSLVAGARKVVRVRLSARSLRRVRSALRRHRSLSLVVRVQAVDGSGNIRTVRQKVRVRG